MNYFRQCSCLETNPCVLIFYYFPRRVYTAVYLSKGNTFQKLTGKNGHVDTLVGYNFRKEKSLPASFKPQEILWLMLTFWKLDPV